MLSAGGDGTVEDGAAHGGVIGAGEKVVLASDGHGAKQLCLLAEGAQVLCITHLPQIARLADHHLAVSKEVRGGRTLSVLQSVYGEQRVLELARMIGGSPDAASVGYARSLLGPWVKVA